MKKITCVVIFIITFFLALHPVSNINAELKKAPNFNLRDPWDKKFSLEQFKDKTIILNFFRIYCHGRIAPYTDKQIQELNKICKEFCKGENCADGDLVIISITMAACPTTDLKEWAKNHNISWFLGNDYDDYNLDVIDSYSEYLSKLSDPVLIFINPSGKVVFTSNYIDASEIRKKLEVI